MSEDFCRHYEQLRKAAKFVRKLHKKQLKEASQDDPAEEPDAASEGAVATSAGSPPPGGAPHSSASRATLRVCTKCVRRLAKKGVDFDPLKTLESISGDGVSVEPVSCLKYCKYGPNAEVELDTAGVGVGAVLEGMTEEEIERRCFQGIADRAAAARVVGLVQAALGGSGAARASGAAAPEDSRVPPDQLEKGRQMAQEAPEEDAPADAEQARRARVRANVRQRVGRILAGIDEDQL